MSNDPLQTTILQLGALTGEHAPLVQLLVARSNGVVSVRELARLDEAAWLELIAQVGVPAAVAGNDEAARAAAYADVLVERLAIAFPTTAIAARLERSPVEAERRVGAYLLDHPGIDLGRTPIDGQVDVDGALRSDLRAWQRRFRLTPRWADLRALAAAGLDSARAVVALGRTGFANRTANLLAPAVAEVIYARAVRVTGAAWALFGEHGGPMRAHRLPVLPRIDLVEANAVIPDYGTLFGTTDLCACAECRSIVGPAAYLVDLLAFLETGPAPTLLDALRERRPDLVEILLTCDNTNVRLPTIDLVAEILEQAVAPRPAGAAFPQTTRTEAELAAAPEHLDSAAYERLRAPEVRFPWSLPFDLATATTRAFLAELGVTRAQLMAMLRVGSPDDHAAETLGSTPETYAILAGVDPAAAPGAWGTDPAWPPSPLHLTAADLSGVLDRSGLELAELTALLATRFINRDGGITVHFADATCDLRTATIDGFWPVGADRLHRFVRLQRALAWTAAGLDRALAALGATELDAAALRGIAEIARLRNELGVELDDLLTWWLPLEAVPPLPVGTDHTLYRTPTVVALLVDRLAVTATDVALLVDGDPAGGLAPQVGDRLGAAELSQLVRTASMARALRLSVRELLVLQRLIRPSADDADPLRPRTPADTRRLVDTITALRRGGWRLAEVDFVLRGDPGAGETVATPDAAVRGALRDWRDGLARIADATTRVPEPDATRPVTPIADPDGAQTRAALAAALPPDELEPALAVIAGTGIGDDDRRAYITAHFGNLVDVGAARAALVGGTAALEDRWAWMLGALRLRARRLASERWLAVRLGEALQLPAAAALELATASGTLERLLALRDAAADVAAWTPSYRALERAALAVRRFGAGPDELAVFDPATGRPYWFAHAEAEGWLDPTRLPAAPTAYRAELLDRLVRTSELLGVRATAPGPVFALLAEVTAGMTMPALAAELARRTGTRPDDVAAVAAALGFVEPASIVAGRALAATIAGLALVRRLGAAPAQLLEWAQPAPSLAAADDLRRICRARYTAAEWAERARPIEDQLREQRRDALVAFLLHRELDPATGVRRFAAASDLYGHYLIDVEMGACQLTSRIKQAIGSVQLFVQRCLLGLESRDLDPARAAEWHTWKRSYRVWQANREVFLYPENWIVPELRDDKTPLFRELETALLQGEVTSDAAERALAGYLAGLDEVARLEVVGTCADEVTGDQHVIARTWATPATYYQRVWRDRRWTPWQRLELDVDGDRLLPVVHDRRLHLFWLVVTEKTVAVASGATTPPPPVVDAVTTALRPLVIEADHLWSVLTSTYRTVSAAIATISDDTARKIAVVEAVQAMLVAAPSFGGSLTEKLTDDRFAALVALSPPTAKLWEVRAAWDALAPAVQVLVSAAELAYFTMELKVFGSPGTSPPEGAYGHKAMEALGSLAPPIEDLEAKLATLGQKLRGDASPDEDVTPVETAPPPPPTYLELQLAWSVFDGDRWSAKQLGRELARIPELGLADASKLYLRSTVDAGALAVSCNYWDTGNRTAQIGQFVIDGCQRTAHVEGFVKPPRELIELPGRVPVPTAPAGMRFTAVGGSAVLQLPDATGETHAVLGGFGPRMRLQPAHQDHNFVYPQPFFYQDGAHSFFVHAVEVSATPLVGIPIRRPTPDPLVLATTGPIASFEPYYHRDGWTMVSTALAPATVAALPPMRLRWDGFEHPYACELVRRLGRAGIDGLLDWSTQTEELHLRPVQLLEDKAYFARDYVGDPAALEIATPFPVDDIDFKVGGAYATYNWELFFHVPLYVAGRLVANQRFEEAQRWLHFIFDPTDGAPAETVPRRVWKLRKFFDDAAITPTVAPVQRLVELIHDADPEALAQLAAWAAAPFNPHLIARLRTTAYQKAVVMTYLDNLIAWGDQLYRRDTIESINEATQLYLLAAELLGPRPRTVAPVAEPAARCYRELAAAGLDAFSNAMVAIENLVPPLPGGAADDDALAHVELGSALYFCIPPNARLAGYWDTLADRLFKIRHCMTIDGTTRDLALFEPPIDPMLLVRATAAGIDLDRVLDDLYAPPPLYRCATTLARAIELCGDVRTLGAGLLTALEKRDAEALARLRYGQEAAVLDAIREVKVRAVDEASRAVAALEHGRAQALHRRDYYGALPFMTAAEHDSLDQLATANQQHQTAVDFEQIANLVAQEPMFTIGFTGTDPVSTFAFGGANLAAAASAMARYHEAIGAAATYAGSRSGTLGAFQRRADDWALQEALAAREVLQLDQQVAGAQVRLAMAERDLATHDLQREHARTIGGGLRDKFTNQELYDWMVAQTAAVYFQCYQLAYDTAKRAERAYRLERGDDAASFIHVGHWDGLRAGLLAGERLLLELRALDSELQHGDRREYELTKHVSLSRLDPAALFALRETGTCYLHLPEAAFDDDFRGHYFRRLKAVTISVPCVVGPYVNVNATLSLLSSSYRRKPDLPGAAGDDRKAYARTATDARFVDRLAPVQSIATSTGDGDAGMFELDLRDQRYLPFEGAGADSHWRLELPVETNRIDRRSISDVVLHVRYTARDGGERLRRAAGGTAPSPAGARVLPPGPGILLSARRDLPVAWHRFHAAPDATRRLLLNLGEWAPMLAGGVPAGAATQLVLVLPRTADGEGPGIGVSPDRWPWRWTTSGPSAVVATGVPIAPIAGSPAIAFGAVALRDGWFEIGTGTGAEPVDLDRLDDVIVLASFGPAATGGS